MNMRRAIVVGANGFLGSNLAKKLALLGTKVTALVARGYDYSCIKDVKGIVCVEFELETLSELDNHQAIKGANTRMRRPHRYKISCTDYQCCN